MKKKIIDKIKYLATETFLKHILIAVVSLVLLIWLVFLSLKWYTHHGQAYSVPDLRGLSLEEVAEIADEKDLRFEIIDSVYADDFSRGTVVEQNPPPDFKVKKNRRIFLTLNANAPEKVVMPDVVEISLAQAKADLERVGLQVGHLEYIPDIARNRVLQQKFNGRRIAPGTRIVKGSKIDLVLGEGTTEEGETNIPKLIGLKEDKAIEILTHSFLNMGKKHYDSSVKNYNDTIKAIIWKQNPPAAPNLVLPLGASVEVWFTVDPTKVKIATAD